MALACKSMPHTGVARLDELLQQMQRLNVPVAPQLEDSVLWAWRQCQRDGHAAKGEENTASTLKAAMLVPCVLYAWKQALEEQEDPERRAYLPVLDRPKWPWLVKSLLKASHHPDPGYPDAVGATITKEAYQSVLQQLCEEALQQRTSARTYRAWTVRLVVGLLLLLTLTTLLLPRLGLALILLPALILGPALGILVVLELDASSSLKSRWQLADPQQLPAPCSNTSSRQGSSSAEELAAATSTTLPTIESMAAADSSNTRIPHRCSAQHMADLMVSHDAFNDAAASSAANSGAMGAAVVLGTTSNLAMPSPFCTPSSARSSADGSQGAAAAAPPSPRSSNNRASMGNSAGARRQSIASRLSRRFSISSRVSAFSGRSSRSSCEGSREAAAAGEEPATQQQAAHRRQAVVTLAMQVEEVLARRNDDVREEEVQALYCRMKGDELRMVVELDETTQQQQQHLQEYAQSVTFKLPSPSFFSHSGRLLGVGTEPQEDVHSSACNATSPHGHSRFKPGLGNSSGKQRAGSLSSTPNSLDAGSSIGEGCPWGRGSSSTSADERSMSREITLAPIAGHPSTIPEGPAGSGSEDQPESSHSSQSAACAPMVQPDTLHATAMAAKLSAFFGRSGTKQRKAGLKQHVLGRMARKAVEEARAAAAAEARRVMAWKQEGVPDAQPGRVYKRQGNQGVYFQENVAAAGALTYVEPHTSDEEEEGLLQGMLPDTGPLDMALLDDADDSFDLPANSNNNATMLGSMTHSANSMVHGGPAPGLQLQGSASGCSSGLSMSSVGTSPGLMRPAQAGSTTTTAPHQKKGSGASKLFQGVRSAVKKVKSQLSLSHGGSSSAGHAGGGSSKASSGRTSGSQPQQVGGEGGSSASSAGASFTAGTKPGTQSGGGGREPLMHQLTSKLSKLVSPNGAMK